MKKPAGTKGVENALLRLVGYAHEGEEFNNDGEKP